MAFKSLFLLFEQKHKAIESRKSSDGLNNLHLDVLSTLLEWADYANNLRY